jgi:hypothetical protein
VVRDFVSLTNNFKEEFLTPLGFKS